jgi:O-antigen/teichoic acid export membrane protein
MDEEIKKIKARGAISASSLLFQSGFSAVLGFVAFFILTLKSGLYLLGIYNTVLAMMNFFNYVTNLGLAAAIIQKPEVKDEDLSTAFFIQLFLAIFAIIIGLLLTNNLFKLYKDLPHNAIYLYWSLLFSFFFLSLKSIPSVLLEKKVKIYKVVFVQLIENVVFYLCVIIFSLLGFDIYSLVIAVVLRSLVGVILIYIMHPWFPKITFSFSSAKSLLAYGIPFQGNSFLSLIKDDLLIIYLGSVIGLKTLGVVTFAKKYGEFSIRLIMDNLNRVAFPIFSRFQKEKELLKKSVEKILFYESFFIFPIIVGAMSIFDSLLKAVPNYYIKWQPAIISFYFFSLSALLVSLSSPFINLFNSIGKVKLSLYFMVLWTGLIWILVPLMIKLFNYQGISIAFFIMSLTFILVIMVAKRNVQFSLSNAFGPPLLATVVMGVYLLITRLIFLNYLKNIYLHLGFSLVGAVAVYSLVVFSLKGKTLIAEIKELRGNFKT